MIAVMDEATAKESFPPVVGDGACVLILGSLPGDESLRRRQYYAHPRNAFWKIMGDILGFDPALPYEERLNMLIRHKIALWDVLKSGVRPGSLDSSISLHTPNDLEGLIASYPQIQTILCNGMVSYQFLRRYLPGLEGTGIQIHRLPSTSPAAAMFTYSEKLAAYLVYLQRHLDLVRGTD